MNSTHAHTCCQAHYYVTRKRGYDDDHDDGMMTHGLSLTQGPAMVMMMALTTNEVVKTKLANFYSGFHFEPVSGL